MRWVTDLRREGVSVTSSMLETKAKEVAEDAGIPVGSFSASYSRKKRFLAKYCMSLRRKTRIGQITPADSAEVASEFRPSTAVNYEYLPFTYLRY
ncbi:hypothetical protein PHMEG_00012757 [Phytophthora megakarya]|uniref:HTH CENPB-type domain-containing protein n=1 Tax=Phytophthora megakarya TaxID=4795 RepID=A0A225W7Y0_9STRA|nr:hypothetical protein PHMEG_00012757 [Phytophthora megakarya]